MKWSEILEGWRNDLFPPAQLKELIEQTQKERLAICLNCPYNSTEGKIMWRSTCKKCGCPLKKKTACLKCQCPIEKWMAEMDVDAEQKILKTINNEPDNT